MSCLVIIVAVVASWFLYFHKEEPKFVDQIYFLGEKLTVFDDHYDFANTFNRVVLSGNYFIVQLPAQGKSMVYNLKTEKKQTEIREIVLAYDGTDVVYNKFGSVTVFNGESIGVNCSDTQFVAEKIIWCITPKEDDGLDNKIVEYNAKTRTLRDVYIPKYTATSFLKFPEGLYVGEYIVSEKKFFLAYKDTYYPMTQLPELIYPLEGKIFIACQVKYKSVQYFDEN